MFLGPTGVGKTEIARRLASLAHAPFIKVEASKFTEVGYVGRDVESIVRDLMDTAVSMVEREKENEVLDNTYNRCIENYKNKSSNIAFTVLPQIKDVFKNQSAAYKNMIRLYPILESTIGACINEKFIK